MKVLSLLSAAAVATALPIHANVRVVSVGAKGEKSVQSFENVDLGDSMESAAEALNHLVKPHAVAPAKMISESEEKLSEIVENEQKEVESHFQDLKEQGMENIETLKQQALEFVEQAKEFLGDASDRVHKVVDSHGEEAKEPLEAPKNFKGKKHGAKSSKHHKSKDANAEDVKIQSVDEKKASLKNHKNHKNNKNNKNHKVHKVSHDQILAHGVKPHAKKPCAKKLMKEQAKAKAQADGSYAESVKQWSQGLYDDVSAIDFNKSIGAIKENDDAMCAIAGGFFGGVALITLMTVIAQFVKGKKSVKLDEESLDEKN